MNSKGHRTNILNSAYNYIGIGIADSPKYGKVFVQMFIGR
ncbi:CAP domain-containing protein [Paradesulfitobacterium aromaticivorans]